MGTVQYLELQHIELVYILVTTATFILRIDSVNYYLGGECNSYEHVKFRGPGEWDLGGGVVGLIVEYIILYCYYKTHELYRYNRGYTTT